MSSRNAAWYQVRNLVSGVHISVRLGSNSRGPRWLAEGVPYHVQWGESIELSPVTIMPLPSTQTAETIARLRCISCGATPDSAGQDFRCTACGDLLEFHFPEWTGRASSSDRSLDPAALKSLWLNRRMSSKALDQSGVWRFRELLPHISEEHAITLREGNTPLYDLPRCARSAGVENLAGEASGDESDGIV